MRKMYIEIQEPVSCGSCPLYVEGYYESSQSGFEICAPTVRDVDYFKERNRPDFCPLKYNHIKRRFNEVNIRGAI